MRVPVATYRLQFNPGFGFRDARKIIPYLSELGISDIYASPVFKARKGSLHGYDIVDPNSLNPELGTMKDLEELATELKKQGFGWIQDIVPNHMAFDGENPMLMDVLENGRLSMFFEFFDIEWDHPYEGLKDRVLAPFLGRLYAHSLEGGEITLQYGSNGFHIQYYDLPLPLRIESYTNIITYRLNILKKRLGDEHPDLIKFLGILYSLKNLPSALEDRHERYHQIQFIKRMLWELYTKNQDINEFINENIALFNGGSDRDFSLLEGLLSEQMFRLSFWKVAAEEINYRRFFNINRLISLRMEDEQVFNHIHLLVLDLVKKGIFTGLRIDHIDGLYDPERYLKRLREKAPDTYIVVEKILRYNEEIPWSWPVEGTTGYDFLNHLNGVFCKENNGRQFNRIYYRFTGFRTSCESILYEKKRLIMEKDMAGDIDTLARLLKKSSIRDRYGSDLTLWGLKRALVEVLASFPVYRTYINHDSFSEKDRAYITEAIKRAKELNPGLLYEFNLIERYLLFHTEGQITEEEKRQWIHFVMRFQQFTGPLMAKGLEDTTLYIYNRLISLNEVGGNPARFGVSLAEFHEFNRQRAERLPHSLNATSTHDTKRGEDVRARINVLSEMPEEWEAHLKRWSRLNQRKKRVIRGKTVPDRNDEYFLYQTLIGAFPFQKEEYEQFKERLKHYILKAVREAKVHTAWLKPDTEYEEAFLSFTERILTFTEDNPFLESFLPFQRRVAYYGIFNSLSQTLIKITSSGIPDFYQGTELWDLNLVDPDNRRPVDFDRRARALDEIKKAEDIITLLRRLLSNMTDGWIKLFLIYRALMARQNNHELFEKGSYIPVEVKGKHREHVIAFAREFQGSWGITIAPGFLTGIIKEGEYPMGRKVWDGTFLVLPEGHAGLWRDVLTTQDIEGKNTLNLGDVLRDFPVALLVSRGQGW